MGWVPCSTTNNKKTQPINNTWIQWIHKAGCRLFLQWLWLQHMASSKWGLSIDFSICELKSGCSHREFCKLEPPGRHWLLAHGPCTCRGRRTRTYYFEVAPSHPEGRNRIKQRRTNGFSQRKEKTPHLKHMTKLPCIRRPVNETYIYCVSDWRRSWFNFKCIWCF